MKKFTLLALGLLIAVFSASATDLANLSGVYTVQNNEVFSGTGSGVQLQIPDGFKITFVNDCSLTGPQGSATNEAGCAIRCLGAATIQLSCNTSVTVHNGYSSCSAIFVKSGKTLEIVGCSYQSSILNVRCSATGTTTAAAIGATSSANCGNITIRSCSVSATGKDYGAGIGGGSDTNCGDINIMADAKVTASAGANAVCAIGKGSGSSTSGKVTIAGVERQLSELSVPSYTYEPWDGDLYNIPADGVVVALNGTDISGDCNGTQAIYIADGATVTLSQVGITSVHSSTFDYPENAITCLGNATIKLEGRNDVYGAEYGAGIFVPQGSTLTIESAAANTDIANGSLFIWGGSEGGAAIGANTNIPAGNIVIKSGYIEAEGGYDAAAIGAGGNWAATCQNITINANVTYLKAVGDPYSIGRSKDASCGTVTIAGQVTGSISESPFIYPTPAWDGNLSTLNKDVVAEDGTTIFGTMSTAHEVTIADGATVTLNNATINGSRSHETVQSGYFPALTCEGNATIVLYGNNSLASFFTGCPAIYVPEGKTLTIKSTNSLPAGKLDAEGWNNTAAIGAGSMVGEAGNIIIESGEIIAKALGDNSSAGAAGIGGSYMTKCGDITILGGTITAEGIKKSPAIGAGQSSTCGKIKIAGWDVNKITATRGADATYSIGKSTSTCGGVYIQKTETEYALVSNDGIKNYQNEATFIYEPTAIGSSTTNLGEIYGLATAYITSYKSYYPQIIAPLEQKAQEVKTKWDTYWYDYVCLNIIANELDQANQTAWAAISEQEDAKRVVAEALQDAISASNDYLTNVIYNLGDEYAQIGYELYNAIGDANQVLNNPDASLQELQDAITDMQNALSKAKEEVEAQGIEDVLDSNAVRTKVIRNGQLFILVGDKTYDAQGKEVK